MGKNCYLYPINHCLIVISIIILPPPEFVKYSPFFIDESGKKPIRERVEGLEINQSVDPV
jgi:hypothetical protein